MIRADPESQCDICEDVFLSGNIYLIQDDQALMRDIQACETCAGYCAEWKKIDPEMLVLGCENVSRYLRTLELDRQQRIERMERQYFEALKARYEAGIESSWPSVPLREEDFPSVPPKRRGKSSRRSKR